MNLEDTLTNLNIAMENEKIDDTLDTTIESLEEAVPTTKQQDIPVEEEDSLESDLFDLIDSMYENREDGE